ncbi:MAG TPA: copper transporter [Solirubrobacteraceae bacterium]|nr:copper transporter [Solirubrobacteraceae bacterium]
MFDYRYHALSLAAVLLALALGVLIGVAIGDSNLVSSAKSGIVHDLESEIGSAHHQLDEQRSRMASEEAFADGLYPLAVHGLLDHRSVGLVFLGGSSDRVDGLVRDAVAEAGGQVPSVVTVSEPLDLDAIERETVGTHFQGLAASPERLERFGYVIGRQLVSGSPHADRELVSRVRSSLLSSFDGQLSHLDGVVVVRSEPQDIDASQSEASTAFDQGLLAGITAGRATAVGAETTSSDPSEISWYKRNGLSSVDDLDTVAGQTALVYALSGARGTYGSSSTADSLLPSVPVPSAGS